MKTILPTFNSPQEKTMSRLPTTSKGITAPLSPPFIETFATVSIPRTYTVSLSVFIPKQTSLQGHLNYLR